MNRAMREKRQAPVGSGDRFKHLVKQLSDKKGITDAPALTAEVGKRKYGASRTRRSAK